jgi:hypothetical protein
MSKPTASCRGNSRHTAGAWGLDLEYRAEPREHGGCGVKRHQRRVLVAGVVPPAASLAAQAPSLSPLGWWFDPVLALNRSSLAVTGPASGCCSAARSVSACLHAVWAAAWSPTAW